MYRDSLIDVAITIKDPEHNVVVPKVCLLQLESCNPDTVIQKSRTTSPYLVILPDYLNRTMPPRTGLWERTERVAQTLRLEVAVLSSDFD